MDRIIVLSKGQIALVDDEDFRELSKHNWTCMWSGRSWYAIRYFRKPSGKMGHIFMHRQIAGVPEGVSVDHKNRDTLNNKRENLRAATKSQQMCNRRGTRNGPKGVFEQRGRYHARIKVDGKAIYLGSYATSEEAGNAYKQGALKYHGEFACVV